MVRTIPEDLGKPVSSTGQSIINNEKKEKMNNNLLFDFTVDKSTNSVFVNREFDATLSLVWDAFTKKEILDQWWAPKPWTSRTKFMNFKEGGRRFYAMVSPEGQEHWSIQDYTSISPTTNFKFIDAFADKDEVINTEFPGSEWDLNFSEQNDTTTVKISIKHKTLASLEQIIQMGFKEGFTMTLNELTILLQHLKQKK
jgi:uncharacterized protein YndB with AHSA1/START domain